MKKLGEILLGLFVIYLGLLAGLVVVMRRPTVFGKVMSKVPEPLMMTIPFRRLWFFARRGNLLPGDVAPDFELPTADKKSLVKLSAFHGQKPVVLIFGSYT